MDFQLSEEQHAIRDMARSFAADRLAPNAAEWDETAHFPVDVLKELAELGLGAIYVRDDVGGSGLGRLDAAIRPPETVTGFFTVDAALAGDWRAFGNALGHLVLPSIMLGWAVLGIISRMIRASMLDVMQQDYIMTARAKGAGTLRVLLRHALRNALVPALTIIGFTFAYLITGAILTETVFSWPGIGSYAVDAARALDHPAIIGVTVLGALAFLLANLLTDIAYVFANPRIRLG